MPIVPIISNLYSKRFRARFRADFPAVYFGIYFILGHLITTSLPLTGWALLLLVFLFAGLLIYVNTWRTVVLACLVGTLAGLPLQTLVTQFQTKEYQLLLKVIDHPRYFRPDLKSLNVKALGEIRSVNNEFKYIPLTNTKLVCEALNLPWENANKLKKGSVFAARVRVRPITFSYNPFSRVARLWRKGVSGLCKIKFTTRSLRDRSSYFDRLNNYATGSLDRVLGTGEASSIVAAMTLGQKDRLSSKTQKAFQVTGLSHLLVVSGYHFTVLFFLLVQVWRPVLLVLPPNCNKLAARKFFWAFSLALMLFYMLIIDSGNSSSRALIALILFVLAHVFERGSSMLNSIGAALVLICILVPGACFELGVQYTFAALLGLNLAIEKTSQKNNWLFLTLPVYASLTTSLITLIYFSQFSLIAFVANILVAPLAAFVVCKGGLIALVLYYLSGQPGVWLLNLIWIFAGVLRDLSWIVLYFYGEYFEVSIWLRLALILLIGILLFKRAYWKLVDYLQSSGVFDYGRFENR